MKGENDITSIILNHTTLEQVVTSYRESELFIPDFDLREWKREPGNIVWTFSKDFKTDDRGEGEFWGCFICFPTHENSNGSLVGVLIKIPGMWIGAGRTLTINYSLDWWYEGGNNDDEPLTLRPAPGRSITLESVLAA